MGAADPTGAERAVLARICDWAAALHARSGRPAFTAAIMRGGSEVARAENRVAQTNDPTRHAEIEAIARACQRGGGPDLAGHTLLASMQPCEMCLSAMRWAGIARLVFAMPKAAVDPGGYFMFPALDLVDFAAAGQPIDWVGGVEVARVRHVYAAT